MRRASLLLLAALITVAVAAGPPRARPVAAYTAGSTYQPLNTPERLIDTRLDLLGIGRMAPESTVEVPIVGYFGIPSVAAGATAVALSVTVTDTADAGYVTLWPAGDPRPTASDLNWLGGETHANLVEVAIQQSGAHTGNIDVYVNHSAIDLIIDVEGYYKSGPGVAGLFRPLTPERLLDTRTGLGGTVGPVGAGSAIMLAVGGRGNVPAHASAVAINLTETQATAPSYVTVYPNATGNTGVSNLNFSAGETRAVRAIVRLDSLGNIGIYNSAGTVQVIVDVSGWFTDSSYTTATGGRFYGTSPTRILDTRIGLGAAGPLGPASRVNLQVSGYPPVPLGASAVVMNLTLSDTTGPTYAVGYAAGGGRPLASDINFTTGGPVPNLDVTPLSSGGAITIYNSEFTTQVIADVVGFYDGIPGYTSPPAAPASFAAVPGDHVVRLSWSPPASNGGSAIVSYDVSVSGGSDITLPAAQTTLDVGGLLNQTAYTVTIVALNGTATSPAATASATPLGSPNAVTAISSTEGASSATLSWQPPAQDGGAPISGYFVWVTPAPAGYAEPIGTTYAGIVVGNLNAGTAYSFTIRALNSYGAGLPASYGPVYVTAQPVTLRVPALGIGASVESVGLGGGALGNPSTSHTVAWQNVYPSPGESGDAIMTGHVDWYDTSCAVFCLLNGSHVYVGMDIYVDAADGRTYHFQVDAYNYYPENSPPGWLYAQGGAADLSLVTCAGDFVNGSYNQRFIAHAHLV
jgi:hypothetical protein